MNKVKNEKKTPMETKEFINQILILLSFPIVFVVFTAFIYIGALIFK